MKVMTPMQAKAAERMRQPGWWYSLRLLFGWQWCHMLLRWMSGKELITVSPESNLMAGWAFALALVLLPVWRLIRSLLEATQREFLDDEPLGPWLWTAGVMLIVAGLTFLGLTIWKVPQPLYSDFMFRAGAILFLMFVMEEGGAQVLLRRRLLDLREQVLRAKLAPHFLFNTLATLRAQMESDPGAAKVTADRLSALFRELIDLSNEPTIPLGQELGFVEAYLGIERARLGRRLKVSVEVPEALESARVPPLALQVLVENAVKHGVASSEEGGTVRIGAALEAHQLGTLIQEDFKDLVVWVEDSGTGQSNHQGSRTALDTLRRRLAGPEDFSLVTTPTGTRASFRWRQP